MANVYAFADRKTIEEEARQWLIRLDGDGKLSQDSIDALHEWVNRSSVHREELLRISAFWDDASILTELSIPLHSKGARRDQPPGLFGGLLTSLLAFSRVGVVAVICLLTIAVAIKVWLFPQSNTATNGIYATAIGELRVQTLADGSVIQINTNSQVQVDYSNTVRKIRLLRGEAHFDVTDNFNWPFEVFAGKGVVKAVGTAFAVRLSHDNVKVTVSEGRVDLSAMVENSTETQAAKATSDEAPVGLDNSSGGYKPVLEKIGSISHGQSAIFSNQAINAEYPGGDVGSSMIPEISTLAEQELARRLSWREGYLVFAGEPLSYVVDEVNRYTPITIDISDPALSQLRIGGRFKVGELDAMLDVLETSFGIQVSRPDDQHIQLLRAQL